MSKRTYIVFESTLILLALPLLVYAAGKPFSYTGWLPFWEKQSGAEDVAIHLYKLREISPFSYEVNFWGALRDKLKIKEGFWPGWLLAVRELHIKVIPSIAWFDGDRIYAVLSKKNRRRAHEDTIARLVQREHFDGIDIDYEGKTPETRPYFSLFIKGLALRLHPHRKILSCTVESRTPPSSRFHDVPKKLEYADDYAVLNQYCDEVRVMAYDQGTIDVKLNAKKGNGEFYVPVADPEWVKKVLGETLRTISRRKIMLGIPTYGYEYEVNWSQDVTTYRRLRSVSYFTAIDLAAGVGVPPVRNSTGELSFTYATSTFVEVSPILRSDVSSTIPLGLAPSPANSANPVTRLVWFTDAKAIAQKIKLAKQYGLRGVTFFKLDGQADPGLWEEMK